MTPKFRPIDNGVTAVFTFVEKKEDVFLNFGSTTVPFLLVSLAID